MSDVLTYDEMKVGDKTTFGKTIGECDVYAFAGVTGDFNPIHTSYNAAHVAGMEAPLVHGMWLSATAQQAAAATDPALIVVEFEPLAMMFFGVPGLELKGSLTALGIAFLIIPLNELYKAIMRSVEKDD